MNKDRLEILKQGITKGDLNNVVKGQLLLMIEENIDPDFILEKLYKSLVTEKEVVIAPEILAKNSNVNNNFFELLKNLTTDNFIETCRILHVKYGLKYKQIGEAMKIAKPTIYAIGNGTFVPSEKLMERGIIALKEFYLGENYREILERI